MPNILDYVLNELKGSPETGRGLLSGPNVMDAMKLTGQQIGGQIPNAQRMGVGPALSLPPDILQKIMVTAGKGVTPPANAMPAQPQGIQSPQQPQVNQQNQPEQPKSDFLMKALKIGIPLAALGAGTFSRKALPGAAGFMGGYGSEIEKQRREKAKQGEKQTKEEAEKWDDAYKTALSLSKTGVAGAMEKMTPQQLEALAQQVYSVKYGDSKTTKEIVDEQKKPKGETVTIEFSDGVKQTMSKEEATQRGYMK